MISENESAFMVELRVMLVNREDPQVTTTITSITCLGGDFRHVCFTFFTWGRLRKGRKFVVRVSGCIMC